MKLEEKLFFSLMGFLAILMALSLIGTFIKTYREITEITPAQYTEVEKLIEQDPRFKRIVGWKMIDDKISISEFEGLMDLRRKIHLKD